MSELPKGWVEVALPTIAYFQEGPGLRKWQFGDDGIPFLNIRTFDQGRLDKSLCRFVKEEEFRGKYEHFLLNEGDIVVSSSGTLGKLIVIHKDDLPVMLNTSTIRFRTLDESVVSQGYLKHWLRSKHFFQQIDQAKTGSAILNYGPSHLKEMKVHLPPLNEQKRIVAKLDELLPKVEACKQRLEKIPTILKRFRQSVLAAAVSGKLTEEWRRKNAKQEVPQTRIQGLKQSRQKLANKSEWKTIEEWFDRCQISDELIGWVYLPAGAVCEFITKGTTPKAEELTEEGEIPFLKVYHIVDNEISFDYKPSFVTREIHEGFLRRSRVYPGDVLMNIVGPPLNKAAIVPDDYSEWNINQALAIFRPLKDVVPEYLQILLCQEATLGEMFQETRGIVGQVNISLEQCRNILIPLPPIEEQGEIVRIVKEFLDKQAHHLNASAKALSMCQRAESAILAKAFSGSLVSQDPTDEPASALIERIRSAAHKNNGKPKAKAVKRGRKSKENQEDRTAVAETTV